MDGLLVLVVQCKGLGGGFRFDQSDLKEDELEAVRTKIFMYWGRFGLTSNRWAAAGPTLIDSGACNSSRKSNGLFLFLLFWLLGF
jgi:hypothetical protein